MRYVALTTMSSRTLLSYHVCETRAFLGGLKAEYKKKD